MPNTPKRPPQGAGSRPPIFTDYSRHLWPALITAVIVATACFFAAKPAYRALKGYRAVRLAESGEQALAAGQIGGAGRSLSAALQLAPRNPQVLRLAARYCTALSLPDALRYWEMYLAAGQASIGERQQFVRLCQDLGRFDLSADLLPSLVRDFPGDRTNQFLMIEHALRIGNAAGAVLLVETNLTQFPGDPLLQFAFARAAIQAQDRERSAKAVQFLLQLARGGSSERLPALRTLASIQSLPPLDAEWTANELQRSTNAPIGDRLLAWDTLGRVHPEKRIFFMREASGSVKPDGPITDIAAIVDWLRNHGSPQMALPLISEARSATNEPLTMLKIELLAASESWPEIDLLLSRTNSPLSPLAKACTSATVEVKKGHRDAAEAFLRAAQKAAANRIQSLEQVTQMALSLGFTKLAIETAQPLLNDSRTAANTAVAFLKLAQKRDDYEIERMVFHHLSGELGSHAIEQKAYINLLDGGSPAKAKEELAPLLKQVPPSAAAQAIAALATLKGGNPDQALALMDTAGIDWSKEDSRWQLVRAMSLRAAGMTGAARSAAAKLNSSSLRAPERELLQRLLDQTK